MQEAPEERSPNSSPAPATTNARPVRTHTFPQHGRAIISVPAPLANNTACVDEGLRSRLDDEDWGLGAAT
jgi:hypothetical protein